MLRKYIVQMPKLICSGENSLERIPELVAAAEMVAVLTDPGVAGAGLLKLPLAQLQAAGKRVIVIDDLAAEPTYTQVQSVADRFRQSGADYIIAVGGGSVMDAAKLTSILASGRYRVQDLLDNPAVARKSVPTLMIPTTAGTGSEATPNAIVVVPEKELKVGIVSGEMVADYVILDERMTSKLPGKIAASTGADALCHAIECWTSRKANPFSDMFALEALDLILNNILQACDGSDDTTARRNMQLASFYAGVAITASGTTAVHALSYPLGGKYHIPHGVSNAILLVPVMDFNEPACRERLAQAYERCCHGADKARTTQEKSVLLLHRIKEIIKKLDIPTSMRELGVPREDLDGLVAAGMEVTRLLENNMRTVTPEDAKQIYMQVM